MKITATISSFLYDYIDNSIVFNQIIIIIIMNQYYANSTVQNRRPIKWQQT